MSDSDSAGLPEISRDDVQELAETDVDDLSDEEVTSRITLSVKRRFDYPPWLLVFEFQNRKGKRADCLALNTSASRDFKLVGFEFKASRDDWRREKRDGQKSDVFVELCDEWYVVAGRRGIVDEDELPRGWGLLELKPSGRLYQLVEPALAERQDRPLDRRFWAKFMKQALGSESNFSYSDLKEAKRRGYQDAKDELNERQLDREHERLVERAEAFEKIQESDLRLYPPLSDDRVQRLKQAEWIINRISADSYHSLEKQLEFLEDEVERKAEEMLDGAAEIRDAITAVEESLPDDGEDGGRDE